MLLLLVLLLLLLLLFLLVLVASVSFNQEVSHRCTEGVDRSQGV